MCTAISILAGDAFFGRNLDYEQDFGEAVTITPRAYPFTFANGERLNRHYAMIGMALPVDGYPLYFDATNEKGLSAAGLNFPQNAYYREPDGKKTGVASFEFVPWVLSRCSTVKEAKELLSSVQITNEVFSETLKPTPLHWLIAKGGEAIVVEQTHEGFCVYDNPTGVLTNNPPFLAQMTRLADFMNLTPNEPENRFSDTLNLSPYSKGMGAMGLPGDLSSASRFVKACFLKQNSRWGETEAEKVHAFFHILYAVFQQEGCIKTADGFEKTQYSSCCNASRGIYYYTTYENGCVNGVDMHREDLNGASVISYDLVRREPIHLQNKQRE